MPSSEAELSYDTHEGGSQIVDNILDFDGKANLAAGGKMAHEAASAMADWKPSQGLDMGAAQQHLAPMELVGSSSPGTDLSGTLRSLADNVTNMFNPGGLLSQIFNFLLSLFSSVLENVANAVLPQIELYEQAAVAALDKMKFSL